MLKRIAPIALVAGLLATGCAESTDGLDDDSIDWSQQCGTLLAIAKDDDQTADYRAKALDRYAENC